MADLVGIFATSHAPLVVRDWARLSAPLRERLDRDFREVGDRLAAAAPDILIEISPDHWVNFFFDNLPSLCIGVGEEHAGPPEPFMKDFPYKAIPGHPKLGQHVVEAAIHNGFEPSVSHRMTLDHGFCIPLLRMGVAPLPRLVPVVVNDLQPPMPSIGRCFAFGEMMAQAVATFPTADRVAILASGGLSHSIGEPTMGRIDEDFDHGCIDAFGEGSAAALVRFMERTLPGSGNGTHEVRNWVVAHGAARARGFELIDYVPAPEVYVGCAFAAWNL